MKRVLIALAMGCLSLSAYAASINWGTNGPVTISASGSSTNTDLSQYVVYLCSTSTMSIADAKSALIAGTWTAPTIATANGSANLNSTGTLGTSEATLTNDFVSGTSYEFYLVILDSSTNAEYALVTSAVSQAPYEGNDSPTKAAFTSSDFSDGWFSITTVPEPTVLALLALGVAGMALKRRV